MALTWRLLIKVWHVSKRWSRRGSDLKLIASYVVYVALAATVNKHTGAFE